MANEQNIPDGAFQLNQDLAASQPPVVPQQATGIPTTDQIIYASADTSQPPAVQYTDPNSTMGKLKAFFAKPIGKVILFTLLFLGIAGMIMYSSSSVGIQGSFVGSRGVTDTTETRITADGEAPTRPGAGVDVPSDVRSTPLPPSSLANPDIVKPAPDKLHEPLQGLAVKFYGSSLDFSSKNINNVSTLKDDKGNYVWNYVFSITPKGDDKNVIWQSSWVGDNSSLSISPDPEGCHATLSIGKVWKCSSGHITFSEADQAKFATGTYVFHASVGDGVAGGEATVEFAVVVKNKPPAAPVWTAPAINAEIAIADLAKTEFKWTPGVDSDNGPSKTPNYQFAIIKGEIADQTEVQKIFAATKAEANTKYDFVWITRWAEKGTQEEIQKLTGGVCVIDINGNSNYTCENFVIPTNILATMKEGMKYTAIVQQGDGEVGSSYATTVFSIKKAEECPTNQYYIKDSKNSGCKKIPNFQGAFSQAGFICGLYETILSNPDNAYRLSSDTKQSLQTNINSQCSKKPDVATNTCLTKMTYVPASKALCEPLKIITDPALSKDVCDQYAVEKNNKSLSADTVKAIATIVGAQCKPKICPTGKYLDGILVPDDCVDVIAFPTKSSQYTIGKSCDTVKKIAASTDALSVYKIDQPTLDQIKIVAKSEGCNPKAPVLPAAGTTTSTPGKTATTATCAKGYYLPTAGVSVDKDCKALPDLNLITSIAEISDACKLYKDLTSGAVNGKMDAETTLRAKASVNDTLCENTIESTPKTAASTLVTADSVSEAPPSLIYQPPVKTIVQTQIPPVQANVLGSLPAASNNASLAVQTSQTASTTKAPSPTLAAPKQYEALPINQVTNYQPVYPVAGTYVPRKTAETGPEMWIYSFGFAFATIGSRKWKNRKK